MNRRLMAFCLRHPWIAYRFHRSATAPFPPVGGS